MTGVAHISRPTISDSPVDGFCRLSAVVSFQGKEKTLWYDFEKPYEKYLVTDRLDAFVVALVPWAFTVGAGLQSECPISSELLYRLKKFFFPLYSLLRQKTSIDLNFPPSSAKLETAGGVGTGLSMGVDSLHAIVEHFYNAVDKEHKLTHLCFFDDGNNHQMRKDREKAEILSRERIRLAEECAADIGLPLVKASSNFQDFNEIHLQFKTIDFFAHTSCAMALGKLFSNYYFASSYHIFEAYGSTEQMRYSSLTIYESVWTNYLCSDSFTLRLAGHIMNRIDKVRALVDWPIAQKYLNVCIYTSQNCGKCPKCTRTLLNLECVGGLEKFSQVFDLNAWRRIRRRVWAKAMADKKNDLFCRSIFQYAKTNHVAIPVGTWLYSAIFRILNWGKCLERKIRAYKKHRQSSHPVP